jgi:hypothetical protein
MSGSQRGGAAQRIRINLRNVAFEFILRYDISEDDISILNIGGQYDRNAARKELFFGALEFKRWDETWV